jgi:hypothetical protein
MAAGSAESARAVPAAVINETAPNAMAPNRRRVIIIPWSTT